MHPYSTVTRTGHALLALLAQVQAAHSEEIVHIGPIAMGRTHWQIVTRAVSVAVTIGLAMILLRLVPVLERLVIRWASKNDKAPNASQTDLGELRQRVETLTRVTGSVARAVVLTTTIIIVLGNAGIAIEPLLAGAGIAGVAIGFGAQSIVKDFFAGFFILMENQYDVGDTVTIGAITGIVERMTMRLTVVRDANGTVYFIPNSNVTNVANKSYGWARAAVDVVFATSVDEPTSRRALANAAERSNATDGVEALVTEPVKVEGPIEFAATGVTWRLTARTRPTRATEVRQAMILALHAELQREGMIAEGTALVVRASEPKAGEAKPST